MENLKYCSENLEKYFSQNRIQWDQFYKSERIVLEKLWSESIQNVLDIGCGCGGLGLALKERFNLNDYTGIEINENAVKSAKSLNPDANILEGDFLKMDTTLLKEKSHDLVFSLSCIDWNLNFTEMLKKAWSMVKPGGYFMATFRLTTGSGINDIQKSYQYINYEGHQEGEIANYVVVNSADLMSKLLSLSINSIIGYGYYGPPGKTAITPFSKLCFAALAIRKSCIEEELNIDLQLPPEIASTMLEITKKTESI